jgi:hypothetical protein
MRRNPAESSKALGPSRGTFLRTVPGAKRTLRLTVIDNAARQPLADPGDSRQQRRGGRVDVNAYGVDAVLNHRIEGARKFVFAEIVLILAAADRLAAITHHVEDADEESWHVAPLRRWLR